MTAPVRRAVGLLVLALAASLAWNVAGLVRPRAAARVADEETLRKILAERQTDIFVPDPDPAIGFRVRPNQPDIPINSMGLRGTEIAPKPQGRKRIVILGDSVTFGEKVPYGETFPSRLQTALRSLGSPWEVVSAAVGGWNTTNEVAFLTGHYGLLDPDVVLLVFVPNDYFHTWSLDLGQLSDAWSPEAAQEGAPFYNDLTPSRWQAAFGRPVISTRFYSYFLALEVLEPRRRTVVRRIAGAARFLRERGRGFGLVCYDDRPEVDGELRRLCREEGVQAAYVTNPFHDPLPDDLHPNPQTHGEIAGLIYHFLRESGLADLPPGGIEKPVDRALDERSPDRLAVDAPGLASIKARIGRNLAPEIDATAGEGAGQLVAGFFPPGRALPVAELLVGRRGGEGTLIVEAEVPAESALVPLVVSIEAEGGGHRERIEVRVDRPGRVGWEVPASGFPEGPIRVRFQSDRHVDDPESGRPYSWVLRRAALE